MCQKPKNNILPYYLPIFQENNRRKKLNYFLLIKSKQNKINQLKSLYFVDYPYYVPLWLYVLVPIGIGTRLIDDWSSEI